MRMSLGSWQEKRLICFDHNLNFGCPSLDAKLHAASATAAKLALRADAYRTQPKDTLLAPLQPCSTRVLKRQLVQQSIGKERKPCTRAQKRHAK